MLPEFCLEKELCMSSAWLKREERMMVAFRLGGNETEIDCVLIGKDTPVVFLKCDRNPWGFSTYACGSRYRYNKNKQSTARDTY